VFCQTHGSKRVLVEKELKVKALLHRTKQFLVSEDGPTATEYAVMLALIIIVALAAITLLGQKVSTIFGNVETALPDGT
jgi:pilus assembly protein Flp/PilA